MSEHSDTSDSNFTPSKNNNDQQVNSSSSPGFDPDAPPFRQGQLPGQGLFDQFTSPIAPAIPPHTRPSLFPHGKASQQAPDSSPLAPTFPLPVKFGDPTRITIPVDPFEQSLQPATQTTAQPKAKQPEPITQDRASSLTSALRNIRVSSQTATSQGPEAEPPAHGKSPSPLNLTATVKPHGTFNLKSAPPESPVRDKERTLPRPHKMSTTTSGASAMSLASLANGNEMYKGEKDHDARKWLARLEDNMEMIGSTEPRFLVRALDNHITGKADKWAKKTQKVKDIINKPRAKVTAQDWEDLKELFLKRWCREDEPLRNPHDDIQKLKQGEDEELFDYYVRGAEVLSDLQVEDDEDPESVPAGFSLDSVTSAWKDGLKDKSIAKALDKLAPPGKGKKHTLKKHYDAAVTEGRRLEKDTEREERRKQEEELELRREYMEKSMNGEEINEDLAERLLRVLGITVPRPQPTRIQSGPPTATTNPYTQARAQPFIPQNTGYGRGMLGASGQNRYPWQARQPSPPRYQNQNQQPRQYGTQPTNKDPSRLSPWELARNDTLRAHPAWDTAHSQNDFINGRVVYVYRGNNALCHICGTEGHRRDECNQPALGATEQSFLGRLTHYQVEKAREAREAREAAANPPPTQLETEARFVSIDSEDSQLSEEPVVWQDMMAGLVESNSIMAQVFLDEANPGNKRGSGEPDQSNRASNTDPDKRPRVDPRCEHQLTEDPSADCVTGKCGHACCVPGARTIKPLKKTRIPASKKPAPQIVGQLGEPHLDVREILKKVNIVLPILDLAQLSPKVRDEVKRLMTLPRKKRTTKKKAPIEVSHVATKTPAKNPTKAQVERKQRKEHKQKLEQTRALSTPEMQGFDAKVMLQITAFKEANKNNARRAFGLASKVWKQGATQMLQMPANMVVVDQGSSINLMYPWMVRKLGLSLVPASEVGLSAMRMVVADHSSTDLRMMALVYLMVEGIIRKVWAFVCPTEAPSGSRRIGILLGMPYLTDVKAVIDVSAHSVEIGDGGEEGRVKVIGGEREPIQMTVKELVEEEAAEESSEETDDGSDEGDSSEGSEDDNDTNEDQEESEGDSNETSEGSEMEESDASQEDF